MANLKIPAKTLSDNFNLQDFKDDFNALNSDIGDKSQLPTTDKTNIVNSIKEISSSLNENTKQIADNTKQLVTTTNTKEKYNKSIFAPRDMPNISYTGRNEVVFDKLFHISENSNMQGLTYYNGYFYIGFDMGGGSGKIVKFDGAGKKIAETPLLSLGHCAELSYIHNKDNILVANGGGLNPTHVYEVNFASGTIIADMNFESLGTSALVSYDNQNHYIILHTAQGGDAANPTFNIIDYATRDILKTFTIPNQGTPQGLEVLNNQIYLYTNNKITVIDFDGNILYDYLIYKQYESEGLTFAGDYGTPYMVVGYNTPNRLYAFRPFENEKVHALKPMHTMSRQDRGHVSLLDRFACVGIRKLTGSWTNLNWVNYVGSSNLVDSITTNSVDKRIIVKLKTPFSSVGLILATPEYTLFYNQYEPHAQLEIDGVSISVRFRKVTDNTFVDPATIPDNCGVMLYIIGGVHFVNDI